MSHEQARPTGALWHVTRKNGDGSGVRSSNTMSIEMAGDTGDTGKQRKNL